MRLSRRPALSRKRSWYPAVAVVSLLAAVIGGTSIGPSPSPARQSSSGTLFYVSLDRIAEYAGTGLGGETSHVVRLEFVPGSGTGSTGSTTGTTTGGTTTGTTASGSTTGTSAEPATTGSTGMTETATADYLGFDSRKKIKLKERKWIVSRDQLPDSEMGVLSLPRQQDAEVASTSTPTGPGSPTATVTTTVAIGVDSTYASQFTKNGSSSGRSQIWGYFPNQPVVYGFEVASGNRYEFRYPGAASRYLYFVVNSSWTDPVTNEPRFTQEVSRATIVLSRRNADAVAIDSRKKDADANVPPLPSGEPLGPPLDYGFQGWNFRGGLFVGNAPYGSSDFSGTARTQLWVPSGTYTDPLGSCLAALSLGSPAKFQGAGSYRVFAPASTDPNLSVNVANAKWSNRWNLATATALASATTLGPSLANEYANVRVSSELSRAILALSDEAAAIAAGTGVWQYFASASYEAQFSTFPLNDSRPRVWTADLTAQESAFYNP